LDCLQAKWQAGTIALAVTVVDAFKLQQAKQQQMKEGLN